MAEFLKNKIPASVSFNPALLVQIDTVAEELDVSRSKFINTACLEKIRRYYASKKENGNAI